jgi:hypothetical protein
LLEIRPRVMEAFRPFIDTLVFRGERFGVVVQTIVFVIELTTPFPAFHLRD